MTKARSHYDVDCPVSI